MRTLVWFSAGAASAVAAKLTPEAELVYCETGAEHPDNERFIADCERWLDRPVTRIRSERYVDTWDVWEKRRYLAGVEGALCTTEMKIMPRLAFQRPDDIHVFGYTADAADVARAERFGANYPEVSTRFPLIAHGLDKANCLGMIERAGIVLPAAYGLGFKNNNCLPCVKATSPSYWALVRAKTPLEFARMAELSRRLDVRLCRIRGERCFIDEIPADWPTDDPIVPSCDFMCVLAETA